MHLRRVPSHELQLTSESAASTWSPVTRLHDHTLQEMVRSTLHCHDHTLHCHFLSRDCTTTHCKKWCDALFTVTTTHFTSLCATDKMLPLQPLKLACRPRVQERPLEGGHPGSKLPVWTCEKHWWPVAREASFYYFMNLGALLCVLWAQPIYAYLGVLAFNKTIHNAQTIVLGLKTRSNSWIICAIDAWMISLTSSIVLSVLTSRRRKTM